MKNTIHHCNLDWIKKLLIIENIVAYEICAKCSTGHICQSFMRQSMFHCHIVMCFACDFHRIKFSDNTLTPFRPKSTTTRKVNNIAGGYCTGKLYIPCLCEISWEINNIKENSVIWGFCTYRYMYLVHIGILSEKVNIITSWTLIHKKIVQP